MDNYIFQNELVKLYKSKYANNDRLAVVMMDQDNCPYGEVTVNLCNEDIENKNCAYVDTNNMEGIYEFLVENGIAKDTGTVGISGFCVYPQMEFDIEKLMKYIKENKMKYYHSDGYVITKTKIINGENYVKLKDIKRMHKIYYSTKGAYIYINRCRYYLNEFLSDEI